MAGFNCFKGLAKTLKVARMDGFEASIKLLTSCHDFTSAFSISNINDIPASGPLWVGEVFSSFAYLYTLNPVIKRVIYRSVRNRFTIFYCQL